MNVLYHINTATVVAVTNGTPFLPYDTSMYAVAVVQDDPTCEPSNCFMFVYNSAAGRVDPALVERTLTDDMLLIVRQHYAMSVFQSAMDQAQAQINKGHMVQSLAYEIKYRQASLVLSDQDGVRPEDVVLVQAYANQAGMSLLDAAQKIVNKRLVVERAVCQLELLRMELDAIVRQVRTLAQFDELVLPYLVGPLGLSPMQSKITSILKELQ